jgi:peptidyl-prolyl cis-trans isomerase SurA
VEIDRIVAVVDEEAIMQSDLDQFLFRVRADLRKQGTEPPPLEILQRQVLERIILQRIQLQQAKRTGIKVDDDTLNQAIGGIAKENKVGISAFREVIEAQGYEFTKFREDIRNEILVSRFKQREVDNRVTVSEREVDNYLKTQSRGGGSNHEYRISQILVATPEAASPETLEKAEKKARAIMERLRGGDDFAKVAVEVSDGQQALEGGDLGWREEDRLPALFLDRVRRMDKGEMAGPLKSANGFHLIRLADKRSKGVNVIEQTHARHILVKKSELSSLEDDRKRALLLREKIRAGEDFAVLARAQSDDRGSAIQGGDLGWANPGQFVPPFEAAMRKLAVGEVSDPIESDFGWHIIQVLERREHDSTNEVERSKAKEAIRKRKIEEETEAWMRQLRDEAYVDIRL